MIIWILLSLYRHKDERRVRVLEEDGDVVADNENQETQDEEIVLSEDDEGKVDSVKVGCSFFYFNCYFFTKSILMT